VAPNLGQHTDEILLELGFSADQIDGLRAKGAIPDPAASPTAKSRAAAG